MLEIIIYHAGEIQMFLSDSADVIIQSFQLITPNISWRFGKESSDLPTFTWAALYTHGLGHFPNSPSSLKHAKTV